MWLFLLMMIKRSVSSALLLKCRFLASRWVKVRHMGKSWPPGSGGARRRSTSPRLGRLMNLPPNRCVRPAAQVLWLHVLVMMSILILQQWALSLCNIRVMVLGQTLLFILAGSLLQTKGFSLKWKYLEKLQSALVMTFFLKNLSQFALLLLYVYGKLSLSR